MHDETQPTVTANTYAEAQRLMGARRTGRTAHLSDLVKRLVARQDKAKANRELSPVRRSIRDQVSALTRAAVGPTPTRERNRQAYVEAIASQRNHLGQVRHVYAGTVSPKVVAKRRARNRMARATRQAQRRHG